MASQRKAKSIRGYFNLTIILFLVGLILFVSGIMALGYFYFQSKTTGLLSALIAATSVFVVAFLLSLFLISRRIRRIYVDALLRTTSHNYRRINESSSTLLDYPHSTIKEFAELNDEVEALRVSLANATLLFDHLDYSKFELIEIPGLENTYELASFQKHLESLIGASMSFRNAIAEVYYPMDNPLSMEEVKTIISSLKSLFSKYKDIAFLLPAEIGLPLPPPPRRLCRGRGKTPVRLAGPLACPPHGRRHRLHPTPLHDRRLPLLRDTRPLRRFEVRQKAGQTS